MKNRAALLFCVWGVMGAVGCLSPYKVEHNLTPKIDPWLSHSTHAKVCVLRPQTERNSSRLQHYDNRQLVGVTTKNQSYFCYFVKPGMHTLQAQRPNSNAIQLRASAQQRYYFGLSLQNGRATLKRLPSNIARQKLQQMMYASTTSSKGALPGAQTPVASSK